MEASPCTADSRRARREQQAYSGIYSYMKDQLTYIKRKIVRRNMSTQSDIGIPANSIDEECLTDVLRLLSEDAKRKISESQKFDLTLCLMNSERLFSIMTAISEQTAHVLDGRIAADNAKQIFLELSLETYKKQFEHDISEAAKKHQQQIEELEQKHIRELSATIEDVTATLHVQHSTAMGLAEAAWNSLEEQLRSDILLSEERSKNQKNRYEQEVEVLQAQLSTRKEDINELKCVVELKNRLFTELKKNYLSHDANEKDRSIEVAARTAVATMNLCNLLQQKQTTLDTCERASDERLSRLKQTFATRENHLRNSISDAYCKIEALQQEHANLLKLHTELSANFSKKLSRHLIISPPSRKQPDVCSDKLLCPKCSSEIFSSALPKKPKVAILQMHPPDANLLNISLTRRSYQTRIDSITKRRPQTARLKSKKDEPKQ